jgi:MFS family permease
MDTDRWLIAWALAGVALGGASLLVPLYVVALGGGATALGVLAGTAALAGAPGALLVGRLADRTGHRRSYLVGSLGLVAATLVALPVRPGIWAVVTANAVVWFAAAAAGPVVTLPSTVGARTVAATGRVRPAPVSHRETGHPLAQRRSGI